MTKFLVITIVLMMMIGVSPATAGPTNVTALPVTDSVDLSSMSKGSVTDGDRRILGYESQVLLAGMKLGQEAHAHEDHKHESSGPQDEHAKVHDHSKDHGPTTGDFSGRLLTYIGKFHVLVVHFPIALLIIASVLETAGVISNSHKVLFAARVNFTGGALAAMVAAGLGLIAVSRSNYPEGLAGSLFMHQSLGLFIAFLSCLGLVSLVAKQFECNWGLLFYRIVVYVLAVLVAVNAHFGGTLVYGPDYLIF